MTSESERIIIEGVNQDGHKFRPSDWCERLATTLASFGEDQRLQYCKSAHPCIINGVNCLIIDRDLESKSPESYAFLMSFASQNRLRVQEDRRQNESPVQDERRARRVLA